MEALSADSLLISNCSFLTANVSLIVMMGSRGLSCYYHLKAACLVGSHRSGACSSYRVQTHVYVPQTPDRPYSGISDLQLICLLKRIPFSHQLSEDYQYSSWGPHQNKTLQWNSNSTLSLPYPTNHHLHPDGGEKTKKTQ